MPLYEYRCKECEHLEEVLQKASDPAPETCPACGKEHTMSKEVSMTSFQLKGGGWYKDLYSSTPGGSDKGDSKKSDKSATKKTDTKKADTKTSAAPAKSGGDKKASTKSSAAA